MACEAFRGRIRPFLEDMLDEKQYADVADHLHGCASCHEYASSIGSMSFSLYELGRTAPPPDLISAVRFERKKLAVPLAARPPFPWTWTLIALLTAGASLAFIRTRHEDAPVAVQTQPGAQRDPNKGYYTFYVPKDTPEEADGQDPDHR